MAGITQPTPASLSPGTAPPISSAAPVASRALDDAKEMGAELLAALRDSATALLDEQRQRAADQIVAVGDALRRSAESLDRDMGFGLGRYGDEAARQVGAFAAALRTRSWSELAGDIEDVARRWPIAYMATAFGIGLCGGRVLLAAAPRPAVPQPAVPQPAGSEEARGGARRDDGAVSAAVAGAARAGDGTARKNS